MQLERRHDRRRGVLAALVLVLTAGCSARQQASAEDDVLTAEPEPVDEATVAMPGLAADGPAVDERDDGSGGVDGRDLSPVLLDGEGRLAVAGAPEFADIWQKWRALPSRDGGTAVMTLLPSIGRSIADTPVSWVSLPEAFERSELVLPGIAVEANAVSEDGSLIALTSFADEPAAGQIAGAKDTTTVLVVGEDGERYRTELDGNFVVEAFGRRPGPDGLPAQLFLLEYLPADAPTHYRVRVLATDTGAVSLPLNLRNKVEQVDERMAGFSRSQVLSDEDGLLFTLYRGTVDGTPEGEPYAFVHTLDLADGVWCLDVDPALELDRLPGALAVGGGRLYLASANGRVASMPVPSITDPTRRPTTDWVVDVARPAERPPVLLADDEGVWVGPDDPVGRLIRLDEDGVRLDPIGLPSDRPTALAFGADDSVAAAGDGWTTFGDPELPEWFGAPVAILTGATSETLD